MYENAIPLRTQTQILLLGAVLLLLKFAAYFLTHSNAIFTDALESIVNVAAGGFGVYALYLAQLPKDDNHPYGHGKIEFVSAAVEGTLIIVAGLFMVYTAFCALQQQHSLENPDIGLLLFALTAVANYLMGKRLIQQGQQHNSATMVAGGKHLQSDAYATLGLTLGVGVVFLTKVWYLDSVIALFFGGFIAYTGVGIVRNAMVGIMDEVDFDLAAAVIDCLQQKRRPEWIDVHNFRIIQYGSALHIDCHVTVPYYYTVEQAHDIVKDIEDTLIANTARGMEVFIHTDPCIPALSCAICAKTDCKLRQQAFQQQLEWNLKNALVNQKHQM
jgi:cation diffusion facilitator family transporter